MRKLKLRKFGTFEINVKFLTGSAYGIECKSTDMALYKYFKPADGLPDPSGPLSAAVSPAAI